MSLSRNDVSVCLKHPGFDTDVLVTADISAFYKVWMGSMLFAEAIHRGSIELDGPSALIKALPSWFALSPSAEATRAILAQAARSGRS